MYLEIMAGDDRPPGAGSAPPRWRWCHQRRPPM